MKSLFWLLIEDDPATNFLNKILIQKENPNSRVEVVVNGQEALDFLEQLHIDGLDMPDMMLLDINMPIMNGWEFLEAYETKEYFTNTDSVIAMLSTSMRKEDKQRALSFASVRDYIYKPLNTDKVNEIVSNL